MKASRGARIWLSVLPTLTVIAAVLAWEALVRLRGLAPIYLPAPSSVVGYLWRMSAGCSLPYNLAITLLCILVGFAAAASTGISFGVLMGMSSTVARAAGVAI